MAFIALNVQNHVARQPIFRAVVHKRFTVIPPDPATAPRAVSPTANPHHAFQVPMHGAEVGLIRTQQQPILFAEVREFPPIKMGDAALCSEPKAAIWVLIDPAHDIIDQAISGGEILEGLSVVPRDPTARSPKP